LARFHTQPTSWTQRRIVSAETVSPRLVCNVSASVAQLQLVLQQLGVRWKRAKHGITSPDPAYLRKKTTVVILTQGIDL
jgi:hypothetical protein